MLRWTVHKIRRAKQYIENFVSEVLGKRPLCMLRRWDNINLKERDSAGLRWLDRSKIMSLVGFCSCRCYSLGFCFHAVDLGGSLNCFISLVVTNEVTQKEKYEKNVSWFAESSVIGIMRRISERPPNTSLRITCGRDESLVTPQYQSLSLPISAWSLCLIKDTFIYD